MNDKRHSADEAKGKPPGRRKIDPDRYRYHKRDHFVAIATFADLNPEQRGIYQTIIDYIYARRGPLPLDDQWLAKICNCDIRVWRRVKRELVEMNRIVVSEEDRCVYDERALRELVDADVVSKTQTDRAKTQGKKAQAGSKRPELRVIDGAELDDLGRTLGRTLGGTLGPSYPPSYGASPSPSSMKSTVDCTKNTSLESQNKNKTLSSPESAPPSRAAQPPGGGGAHAEREKPAAARDMQKWLAEQAAALGVTTEPGKDQGDGDLAEPIAPDEAADRKARRK